MPTCENQLYYQRALSAAMDDGNIFLFVGLEEGDPEENYEAIEYC